jgi:hypothetical protein
MRRRPLFGKRMTNAECIRRCRAKKEVELDRLDPTRKLPPTVEFVRALQPTIEELVFGMSDDERR